MSHPTPDDTRAIALQRVGGIEATLNAIVQTFAKEAPELLEDISRAIESQAASDCERAAHTLKGSADILGLEQLVRLALNVERQGRGDDLEAARRALPELRAATSAALARIATW